MAAKIHQLIIEMEVQNSDKDYLITIVTQFTNVM